MTSSVMALWSNVKWCYVQDGGHAKHNGVNLSNTTAGTHLMHLAADELEKS